MTPREAFYYGLSITGQNAGDKLSYQGFVGSSAKTYQWGDFYASYFDKENYIKAANDEFKRVPYLTQKFKELNEGIKNVDFSKTFYFTVRTGFGTYNTDCGCFPLNGKDFLNYNPTLLDIKEVGNNTLVFDNSFARFRIMSYANFNDFDYVFKIKSSEAERFIESKKDNSGNISRQVTLKVIYNLTKKGNNGIKAYIHKIEFYNGTNLLGSALPKFNYYDKINLVKIKDGVDKIYFNKDWNTLSDKDVAAAKFYRTTTYKDGKTDGPLTDYFISGAKQMTGTVYDDVWIGQFIWYYEDGQKSAEATYDQGKLNGKYISWYSNGQKSEEVNYIDGKKDGCDYKWRENGISEKALCPSFNCFVDYYKDGEVQYQEGCKKCPCISSKQEALSQTNNNSNNTTEITIADLAGTYNGISESAGSTITISSDASVIFKINGNSFTGSARTLNTKEKDHESVKRKTKAKLNKDVEVTGYDLVFAIAANGQTKDAHFALLKDEGSIILWGGGDAFFEKKK